MKSKPMRDVARLMAARDKALAEVAALKLKIIDLEKRAAKVRPTVKSVKKYIEGRISRLTYRYGFFVHGGVINNNSLEPQVEVESGKFAALTDLLHKIDMGDL